MSDIVRVLRVIEYVGEREWIESTLKCGLGNGTHQFGNRGVIKSAIIDQFPEMLDEKKEMLSDEQQ